jgi:hypothetical protein
MMLAVRECSSPASFAILLALAALAHFVMLWILLLLTGVVARRRTRATRLVRGFAEGGAAMFGSHGSSEQAMHGLGVMSLI